MTYLLTEVADRERLANQSRAISLSTWAASLLLIAFALAPSIRNNPLAKAVLIFAGCGMTAVSRATAGNLATHDRILQDFRDISDNQRQQLIYEALAPKQLMKSAEAIPAISEPIPPLPVHNISRTLSDQLKSTVLLGAPRAGKGYAIAQALQQLPSTINLWLIDPKDDPEETYYWTRISPRQRVRFDVTTLDPAAVDAKVTDLFDKFLCAPSTAARPKLLIVDECSPGLSKGMTPKAYKAFMGRLSTICSVGPSKGKFVWIMAQASTVEDLAMTSGNKASFRLCAVGHAERTEQSWFSSLKRSLQIDLPSPALTGYIQMVKGQWGNAHPFEVSTHVHSPFTPPDFPDTHPEEIPAASTTPTLPPEEQALTAFLREHADAAFSLRDLTSKGFAKRLNLRSLDRLKPVTVSLLEQGIIETTADGLYQLIQNEE